MKNSAQKALRNIKDETRSTKDWKYSEWDKFNNSTNNRIYPFVNWNWKRLNEVDKESKK